MRFKRGGQDEKHFGKHRHAAAQKLKLPNTGRTINSTIQFLPMHEQQGMLCGKRDRDKKKTNQSRMITAAQRKRILVDFVRDTLVAAANRGSLLNNIDGTFTCV